MKKLIDSELGVIGFIAGVSFVALPAMIVAMFYFGL